MKRYVVLACVLLLSAIACGDGGRGGTGGDGRPAGTKELIVQPASYDLASGDEQRFIVGLLTPDQLFVSYGEVTMDFTYMGTKEEPTSGEPGPGATGSFLPIPGDEDLPDQEGPVAGPASSGRGVYGADVTFDRAGFWEVTVSADVDGIGTMKGSGAFEVAEKHLFPAIGDGAPNTHNVVEGEKGVPPAAVDSRFDTEGEIPDPELHDKTIASSLAKGRAVMVVISTPVYCISRFCGPITDMVADLAQQHDELDFVHIEVWRNFQKKVVNRSAADWIYRDGDLLEPWVFLVSPNGKIIGRWDNVATQAELEAAIEDLPR